MKLMLQSGRKKPCKKALPVQAVRFAGQIITLQETG